MKLHTIKLSAIAVMVSLVAFNCSKNETSDVDESADFAARNVAGVYVQEDQMARPAINTVFVSSGSKDLFNVTIPSEQSSFQASFEARLLALNPAYTVNALGLDATTLTTILATDVLTVSLVGTTTFFDGPNVLTGRALADDVIDTELLLIFGGPDGTANPTLTTDFVDANDKAFLTSFPYAASPW